MEKLSSFSPKEVQMILCGNQSPSWNADDIISYTEPKLGYTRDRCCTVLSVSAEDFCPNKGMILSDWFLFLIRSAAPDFSALSEFCVGCRLMKGKPSCSSPPAAPRYPPAASPTCTRASPSSERYNRSV